MEQKDHQVETSSGNRRYAGCALIAAMVPGGVQRRISAESATSRLRTIHPDNAAEAARKEMALELVADIRRLDANIAEVKKRTTAAVAASGTTVTEVYGVGPIVAALLIGHTGDRDLGFVLGEGRAADGSVGRLGDGADDRARLVASVRSAFGRLHLLVNNAGVAPAVRADEIGRAHV